MERGALDDWSAVVHDEMNVEQTYLRRFLRRLLLRSQLGSAEQESILALRGRIEAVRGNRDFIQPGKHVRSSALVLDGVAARFDQQREGERQFTALYIPGDMCDLHSAMLPVPSWGVQAVSHVKLLHIPHDGILDLSERFPAIASAFWRDTAVDSSIIAKWASNIGCMDAPSRMAHLFCELGLRMSLAGLSERTSYVFGGTQSHLAQTLALTPIHVNRVLQKLRARRLVEFRSGSVDIVDWEGLAGEADFDSIYLQISS